MFKEDHEMIKRLNYLRKLMKMIMTHIVKVSKPSVKQVLTEPRQFEKSLELPNLAERSSSKKLEETSPKVPRE